MPFTKKREFYFKCLHEIGLPEIENITVQEIRDATRALFHRNNPKNIKGVSEKDLVKYEEKFFRVKKCYDYIRKYR